MQARFFNALAVFALFAAVVQGDATLTRQHADSFQRKIFLIAEGGRVSATDGGPRRTALSETELNSWFAYHAQPLIPQGVTQPKISIIGQGKVAAEAIVDLDAVAKQKATGGALDLWSYVGGRVPVSLTGILYTKDGVGQFQLQTVEVSRVPMPKAVVQELVAYYSRTENHPRGIDLEAPFELPAGINRIEVGQGQAVVVQ